MQRLTLFLVVMVLAACSPRGTITIVPAIVAQGPIVPIYVATTRGLEADGVFTSDRAEDVTFARFDIAVPPKREVGTIKWPGRGARPNPARDFLTTQRVIYPAEADFRTDLSGALRAQDGEAVIFVHGYNNTFSEGLYRIAQLSNDLELTGVALHYSWPSAAKPLGYVYDRDSALFARDGLEAMITEVTRAGAKRITLVAHSMGSTLVMEALRQSAIRSGGQVPVTVNAVVLISPDIDVDVFRAQAKAMGRLPQPFLIFGSDRDRLLKLSARLTGQGERLGSLSDVSRLADLDVTFFDVAAFEGSAAHDIGSSAALIKLLGRIGDVDAAFETDRVGRVGIVSGVVLTVQSATQVILRPVANISDEIRR